LNILTLLFALWLLFVFLLFSLEDSGDQSRDIHDLRANVKRLTEQFANMSSVVSSLQHQMSGMTMSTASGESASLMKVEPGVEMSLSPLNLAEKAVEDTLPPAPKKRKYVRRDKSQTKSQQVQLQLQNNSHNVAQTDVAYDRQLSMSMPVLSADNTVLSGSLLQHSDDTTDLLDFGFEGMFTPTATAPVSLSTPATTSPASLSTPAAGDDLIDMLCDFDRYDSQVVQASPTAAATATATVTAAGSAEEARGGRAITQEMISGILQQLDVKLQERFVDKLAHVVGTLLVKSLPAGASAPEVLRQMTDVPVVTAEAHTTVESVSTSSVKILPNQIIRSNKPTAPLPLHRGTRATGAATATATAAATPGSYNTVTVVSPSSSIICQAKLLVNSSDNMKKIVRPTLSIGLPGSGGVAMAPREQTQSQTQSQTQLTPSSSALMQKYNIAKELANQGQTVAEGGDQGQTNTQGPVIDPTDAEKFALYSFILGVLQCNTQTYIGSAPPATAAAAAASALTAGEVTTNY